LGQLSRELSRAHRKGVGSDGKGPNIGYFDIDYFKQVNDNYGHQVGDEVLIHVASQISCQLREYDSFGRLGGDEFLLVVPELDEIRRKNIFERLMNCISGVPFNTSVGEITITLSMGVAAGEPGQTVDQLLARADAALYQAKHEGRNRLVFA
jgi:diguanylate cyclase (GGDEF)-like protein